MCLTRREPDLTNSNNTPTHPMCLTRREPDLTNSNNTPTHTQCVSQEESLIFVVYLHSTLSLLRVSVASTAVEEKFYNFRSCAGGGLSA